MKWRNTSSVLSELSYEMTKTAEDLREKDPDDTSFVFIMLKALDLAEDAKYLRSVR